MKKLVPALLLLAVSACSAPPTDDPGTAPSRPGTGGSKAAGGSGGSKAGSGGSPSSGTGGSSSGGSTGSGGSTTAGSGGSTAGSGGSTAGSGGSTSSPDAATAADTGLTTPPAAGAYAPCPKCKALFDGTNLDSWNQAAAGAWVIKAGAMASTGKAADAWTKEDFGNYRIFFSVRQISGNHQPGTLYFGNRNGDKPARGLAGIQIQPPNGYTWDYRPNKNTSSAALFMKLPAPKLDVKQWSQCEVLVKEAGEMRYACCQLTGATPCKATEMLRFKDPTAGGKKSPFGLQMHNGGLFDEYKDIYVETDPAVDDLLSTK